MTGGMIESCDPEGQCKMNDASEVKEREKVRWSYRTQIKPPRDEEKRKGRDKRQRRERKEKRAKESSILTDGGRKLP